MFFAFDLDLLLEIPGQNALSVARKSCHDMCMAKFTSLRDAYRHPGFVPMARIQSIEDDSSAWVVSLRRRQKKWIAARAVNDITASTITTVGKPVTSTAEVEGFCSNSTFTESSVRDARL